MRRLVYGTVKEAGPHFLDLTLFNFTHLGERCRGNGVIDGAGGRLDFEIPADLSTFRGSVFDEVFAANDDADNSRLLPA